ncbi:MAG: arabinan endo-1,5-alpha-L-arabinosidase [Pseudomonadota bacterium]
MAPGAIAPMHPPLRFDRRALLGASAAVAFGAATAQGQTQMTLNDRLSGDLAPVHDPCIIRQGTTFYVFCTTGSSEREPGGFIACRTSHDLITWTRTGYVFDAIPAWALAKIPNAKGVWAPDISFYNGRYHLYYAVSTFGSNHSVIGLATNATLDQSSPDFAWRDEGLVLESQQHDRFNAIDPNLVLDQNGGAWLVWGSFWSGIKGAKVDVATGKLDERDHEIHNLAARPDPVDAIEAPYVIQHNGFYYLFCSYDFCCRGVNSTYFVACGRSQNVMGPYEGVNGQMMRGGASVVIQANDRFKGPGHCAVLHESDRDFLVYHAYDAQNGGRPTLRISQIYWTPDGWPRAML